MCFLFHVILLAILGKESKWSGEVGFWSVCEVAGWYAFSIAVCEVGVHLVLLCVKLPNMMGFCVICSMSGVYCVLYMFAIVCLFLGVYVVIVFLFCGPCVYCVC